MHKDAHEMFSFEGQNESRFHQGPILKNVETVRTEAKKGK